MAGRRFHELPRVGGPLSAGDLVSAAMGTMARSADGTVRAGYAWNLVAGDSGRRHTMGLYLEQHEDRDPVLKVYLDSSPLIQDFATDHLLYERRLAEVGLPVSRVRFELSRKAGQPKTAHADKPAPSARPIDSCPPLGAADRGLVDACSSGQASGVSEAMARAMEAVMRREKDEAGRSGGR